MLVRSVVPLDELSGVVDTFTSNHAPDILIIGGGTGSSAVVKIASKLPIPHKVVDERLSTQNARQRYFIDHPPKGWRRLIPQGLLVPPENYDDYAAVILAEEYLRHE